MKKVLAAGAALMLAGSIASAAYAEVNLSGDARVRYIGQTDYQRVVNLDTASEDANGYYDEFDSRIRVKFDATATGGAFMKARLRFDDFSQWDGQGWDADKNENVKNVWADYAFIGIPMGDVTVSGGRMPADYSKFFSWDNRPTRLKADWKSGNVRLIALVDVKDEVVNANDDWDDNDFMAYGLVGAFQINDDWSVKGYARYHDDEREWTGVTDADGNEILVRRDGDNSGFLGSIYAEGKAGTVGLEAEIAYKEADVQGTNDDGLGAYIQASLDMGAFTPAFQVGLTQDGYQADPDFGFIMIGADEPITVVTTLGTALGDAYWAAFITNYAVSERLALAGNLVYYDIDTSVSDSGYDIRGVVDAWELSGSIKYEVSEGATLTYKLGYLSPSYDGQVNSAGVSDDAYFGHYAMMSIKF